MSPLTEGRYRLLARETVPAAPAAATPAPAAPPAAGTTAPAAPPAAAGGS
jgi:hypothetical protein